MDVFGAATVGAGFAGAVFFTDALGGTFVFFAAAFGAAAAFLGAAVFTGAAFLGVSATVLVFFGAGAVFFVAGALPDAFRFQPNLFNLPTTAFLDKPKRFPISDVDNPLPVNAFSFFNVALSQPLLILQNPCYTL